jgi:hypothetical protein
LRGVGLWRDAGESRRTYPKGIPEAIRREGIMGAIYLGFVWGLLVGGCGPSSTPEPETMEPPALIEATPEPTKKVTTNSEVRIVSLKNGSVEDTHTLGFELVGLYLGLPDNPSSMGGEVRVDLASWSSPIAPRDERVKQVFFKLQDFHAGTFYVEGVTGFGPTEVGATSQGEVSGTFEVSGGSFSSKLKVSAERKAQDTWVFRTVEPMAFTAAQLGASDRVQEVAQLCGVALADTFKLSFDVEKKF